MAQALYDPVLRRAVLRTECVAVIVYCAARNWRERVYAVLAHHNFRQRAPWRRVGQRYMAEFVTGEMDMQKNSRARRSPRPA